MRYFLSLFAAISDRPALIWRNNEVSYGSLLQQITEGKKRLEEQSVTAGAVVALWVDSPVSAVAWLLASLDASHIVIPYAGTSGSRFREILDIAEAEWVVDLRDEKPDCCRGTETTGTHPLYARLRESGHPGLVLFSSGSTGKPKGTVLDASRLLKKYETRRRDHRTLAFLLFDHIGGLDTLFYALSNGSCLVFPEERTPDGVCATIERHRVEVLPATPSFLNLLLLSEAHKRHDLSSLRWITYGAEVMPETTLRRLVDLFPNVRFLQKYGTTEVGTLRSKSREPGSLWLRIGGEGYQTRVVDGILQIKSEAAMLGYLNAPSPITEDGWFDTGDEVIQEGEYLRVLGRKSDIINVGGEKVFPAEVEDVIRQMPNVAEAIVYGEANLILGQVVCARVTLVSPETRTEFFERLQGHCRPQLEPFKIPVKVVLADAPPLTERLKRTGPRTERDPV